MSVYFKKHGDTFTLVLHNEKISGFNQEKCKEINSVFCGPEISPFINLRVTPPDSGPDVSSKVDNMKHFSEEEKRILKDYFNNNYLNGLLELKEAILKCRNGE